MLDYFKERMDELRQRYAATGNDKFRYQYEELARAREYWTTEQIIREQSSGQSQGRRYDPFSPYL